MATLTIEAVDRAGQQNGTNSSPGDWGPPNPSTQTESGAILIISLHREPTEIRRPGCIIICEQSQTGSAALCMQWILLAVGKENQTQSVSTARIHDLIRLLRS